MKKHLSVFELAARGAVYKTLAVGLAAAAAIFALLLAGLDDVENLADVLTGLTLPYEGANGLPSAALAGAAYGAGMVLLYFLLARSLAPRRGVNPDATFRRLLIPEREAAIYRFSSTRSASPSTGRWRWRPTWASRPGSSRAPGPMPTTA